MEIELLNVNEGIIDRAAARSSKLWDGLSDDLWKRIEKLLRKFPTNGARFDKQAGSAKLLATLRKELQGLIPQGLVDDFMKEVLVDFDGLAENIRAVHSKENDIDVGKQLVTEQKAALIDDLAESLNGAGYEASFATPVKKVLYTHVNLGLNVVQAEQALRVLVYGSPTQAALLNRYSGQMARDALSQYQGRVNKSIQERFELPHIRYVGNIIKDSRWQCRRWVEMEWLKVDSLKAEIRLATNRGRGMIPGTTPDTFVIFRGGYNCLHTAFPSRGPQ